MAVGVGAEQSSAALTLSNSWQTFQASGGGDLEITLDANQMLELEVETDFQATPTDDAEWRAVATSFSSTAGLKTKVISGPYSQSNVDDPNSSPGAVNIFGKHLVKIQARQTGTTDTSNSSTARYKIHTMS